MLKSPESDVFSGSLNLNLGSQSPPYSSCMPRELLLSACHLDPYLEMCLVGRRELVRNVQAAVKEGCCAM